MAQILARSFMSDKRTLPAAFLLPGVIGATSRSELRGYGAGTGDFWFRSRHDDAGRRAVRAR